jgi:hypothetical protein
LEQAAWLSPSPSQETRNCRCHRQEREQWIEIAVDYFALPLLNYQQFQADARGAHDVPHPDDFDFSQGAALQELLEDEHGGYDSEGNHTGEYDTYETVPTKPAPS